MTPTSDGDAGYPTTTAATPRVPHSCAGGGRCRVPPCPPQVPGDARTGSRRRVGALNPAPGVARCPPGLPTPPPTFPTSSWGSPHRYLHPPQPRCPPGHSHSLAASPPCKYRDFYINLIKGLYKQSNHTTAHWHWPSLLPAWPRVAITVLSLVLLPAWPRYGTAAAGAHRGGCQRGAGQ